MNRPVDSSAVAPRGEEQKPCLGPTGMSGGFEYSPSGLTPIAPGAMEPRPAVVNPLSYEPVKRDVEPPALAVKTQNTAARWAVILLCIVVVRVLFTIGNSSSSRNAPPAYNVPTPTSSYYRPGQEAPLVQAGRPGAEATGEDFLDRIVRKKNREANWPALEKYYPEAPARPPTEWINPQSAGLSSEPPPANGQIWVGGQ